MSQPAFTLYYLPMRARAEPIKMMLHCANVPFNDVTIPFTSWPDNKQSMDICPFGQLPTLQLPNGEILAQSGAIIRYVGKLTGLYPSDPLEAARADMVHELAQDMNAINAILNFWARMSDAYAQNKENYFKNFPRYAGYAVQQLGNRTYFGGTNPHFGDFSMFHILDISVTVEPACLNDFPHLINWMNNMRKLPKLHEYLYQRQHIANLGMCGSLIQTIVPMTLEHAHHPGHK